MPRSLLPNSILLENLFGIRRVVGVELFSAVGAGIVEYVVDAARVVIEVAGAIVDMAVDDDPCGVG